ncbi:hypothetical protein OXYTRIMIC_781 [Oxytricha trifallax]|uniref:Uncharacterized protein n=1 Tax=Oxytricha trifallax TaxID=1172189 RepID=A0A073ICF5_9SPIT|nr:hypothetical protein OXYTRIMIC_781 [Oxytricha trifallax]
MIQRYHKEIQYLLIQDLSKSILIQKWTADTKESSQEEKLLGKRSAQDQLQKPTPSQNAINDQNNVALIKQQKLQDMQKRLEELKKQEEAKKRSESKVYQTNSKQNNGQRLQNQSQSGSYSSSSQSDQEGSDESDGEDDSNESSSQECSNSKSSKTLKRRARGRGKGIRVKRAFNSSDEEDDSYFDPAVKKLRTDMKAEGSSNSSNINVSHKPKKRGRPSKKDLQEREKALKAQEKLLRQQKRQLEQTQLQQQQQRKLSNSDQKDISKINKPKLKADSELNSDEIQNLIQWQNHQSSQPSTYTGYATSSTGIKHGRGRPPKHSQSFSSATHQKSNM